jgi:hypothetical protein
VEALLNEETRPKRKAKDNPWYRLATFHGEPSGPNDEIQAKNRETWNRWFASKISDDRRAALLGTEQYTFEELTPFPEDELRSIRSQTGTSTESSIVDFSDIEFDAPFFASNFILSRDADFRNATFSGDADFGGATISGDADFRNATFSRDADFRNATFSRDADFRNATFSGYTIFGGATISGNAIFGGATISGDAHFGGATFSRDADFRNATFSRDADFRNATFSVNAIFCRATFSDDANFGGATFSGDAIFGNATFRGYTDSGALTISHYTGFGSATFSGYADFGGATFSGDANFGGVTFSGDANFSVARFSGGAQFTNAEMKARTSFDDAKFSAPPQCFNTKLHEGTTWHGVQWPEPPGNSNRAREFIDAYERLKLEMDRLKKHGDELDFFSREQQCRRVVLGPWKGFPIAIYGFLSDYGRSYSRPLVLLATTVLVGSFLFAVHLIGFRTPLLPSGWRQAIGISFTNTLGLFGRPLMKADALVDLPDWLKAVATVQSILGLVLLFLFGLGIRNRFRMK